MSQSLIAIRFTRPASKYNAGETAEFLPERAAEFVRAGVAAYEDPDMILPEIVNDDVIAPRVQKEAQRRINRIAAHMETLDEGNLDAWEQKTNKPAIQYVSLLFGQSITVGERDQAFDLVQKKRAAMHQPPLGPKATQPEAKVASAGKR